MTSTQPEELVEADDIAAQTFLVAFSQREACDLAQPPARPWLYGIATNLITRHRRDEIKGVSVEQDAVDAAGRRGTAFVYTGAWERFGIIVSSDGYRFLGTYGESVADRTFPSDKVGTVKAGTPAGLDRPPGDESG